MSNYYEPKNNDSMYLGGESDWKQMWPKYDEVNGLPSARLFQPTFEDVFKKPDPAIKKAFLDRLNGKEEPVPYYTSCSVRPGIGSSSALSRQVGGSHYKDKGSSMQPWAIIDAWGLDFYAGNVLKYILRYKHKGGLEDLQKARHYLDKLIEDADSSANTQRS
jgi:hypothetical protein